MKTPNTWEEGTIDIPGTICKLDSVSKHNNLNIWKSILFDDFMYKHKLLFNHKDI